VTPETFNQIVLRHRANLELRRQSRFDEFFRNELLDDVGEIVIGQSRFHPADVLERMKPEEYERAQVESKRRQYDQLIETVCEAYPSPIARPYDSFTKGSRLPLRRLLYMKDTWEAVTATLYAILLSECIGRAVDLSNVLVRTDSSGIPTPIRRRDLLDWRISMKLGIIEGILVYAEEQLLELACSSVIPLDVVGEMRRLNDVRNEFSHSQTKSDRQASRIIEECEQDLLDVLGDLHKLDEVELFRVEGVSRLGNVALEVERLAGYTGARRIVELSATADQLGRSLSGQMIDNFDRVLMKLGIEIYDLSPFFYCSDDVSGHRTRLHMLKQHKAQEGKLLFEIVAESEVSAEPDDDFLADIDLVKSMVG